MKLVKDAYTSWGAEVVFITSNWAGNREIMEGCKEAGIPAFVSLRSLIALYRGSAGHSGGPVVLTLSRSVRRVHCGISELAHNQVAAKFRTPSLPTAGTPRDVGTIAYN